MALPDPSRPSSDASLFHAPSEKAERGTRRVLLITLAAMVLEIGAGWGFNSMALLADGWHMSSHALAIGLSVLAYAAARRWAHDPRFTFGTWKVEVLAGFTSALFLLFIAALMAWGSVERLLAPQPIGYPEALAVAVFGLAVNLGCARILHGAEGHEQAHSHSHGPGPSHGPSHDHRHDPAHGGAAPAHRDLNLKAAYVHVLTDAATSVLAIAALAGGWRFGWDWLDPLMGLLGALLVALWARGLLRETALVLLDREMDHPVVDEIREALAGADVEIADLRVWRVGRRAYAAALTAVTHDPALTPAQLRERLAPHEEIVHATIELQLRR